MMRKLLGLALIAIILIGVLGEETLKRLLTVTGPALLIIAGVFTLVFVLALIFLDILAMNTKAPDSSKGSEERPDITITSGRLTEKQMVDLIARYPQQLLGEPLTLEGREVCIGNCRLDLLFRKGPGRLVAVEVKAKQPNRDAIRQVLEYAIILRDEDREELPEEWVRLVLVAPSINPVDKRTLRNQYIHWREIPQERFLGVGCGHDHL